MTSACHNLPFRRSFRRCSPGAVRSNRVDVASKRETGQMAADIVGAVACVGNTEPRHVAPHGALRTTASLPEGAAGQHRLRADWG